jgi:hypothetical protein
MTRVARRGVLLASALVLWPPPAPAASFTLGDPERADAVRAGERSIISDAFGSEWTVANPAGERVLVMTPFHRLAQAARTAAFRGESLTVKDVEAALKGSTGRLVFWATLRGARPDFARFYAPALLGGRSEIKPTFVQNERTALAEDGRYTARCVYAFPIQGIDPKGQVTLVVRTAEAREVARFSVDLSAMR